MHVEQNLGELPRIIPILRRRWWLLLLSILIAGTSSYVLTKRIKPTYQASARVFVDTSSASTSIASYGSAPQSALMLASAIAEIATSHPVADRIRSTTQSTLPASVILGDLQASASADTPIVTIVAKSINPAQAAMLANADADAVIAVNQAEQSTRYTSLESTVRGEINATSTRITTMSAQLLSLASKGSNGVASAEVSSLTTQLNTLQNYLSSLNTQLNTILLSQSQSATTLSVIERAQVPTSPVSPKLSTNLALALVLGLLLAAAVIAALEYLDDSLRSPQIIEERLKLPVLATIFRFTDKGQEGVLVSNRHQDRNAEAFRALRTNVQFLQLDRSLTRVLVTSGRESEGKSTVAANYALVAAQAGKRVVLIDCDLRRPSQHKLFALPANPGLSELLLGLTTIEEVRHSTGTAHLSLICSGRVPPNPSELLTSNRMHEILEAVAGDADLVILDSPPALSVTDAVALATRVDGVLLVLDGESTKMRAAMRTVQSLQLVGGRVLGVVLNRYDALSQGYGGYDYHYYSGDYHSDSASALPLTR